MAFSVKPPQPQLLQEEGGCPEACHEGALCSEQHAGSVGMLLDFEQPPCARGLQSEAEGAAREEEEEEEQAFQVSLEDLAGHEGREQGAGPEPPGEEEEEEEESLAVAEQVADFASSLLAALHCWHYRANALLFSRGAMVRCLFDLPLLLACPLARACPSKSPLPCPSHPSVLVPSFLPSALLNTLLTVTPW